MKTGFLNDSLLPSAFPIAPGDPSGARSNTVYGLANDANFDAAHLSEPLTEYIRGVPDTDRLQEVLDAIAPPVPTGRRFSYMQHNEAAAFQHDQTDDGDIRPIGGDFKQVANKGTQTDGATDNKGLMIVLDNDDGGEDPAVQQYHVANLRNRLLRSDVKRAVALIDANDTSSSTPNWGASNTTADPDGDLLTLMEDSQTARGCMPNVLLIGGLAALRRKLALRRQATSGGFATAQLTDEQLADFLGVEKVVTLRAAYQSSSTAKTRIAGSEAYAYYAQRGATKDDPSNIKRFVTMTQGGLFRVYIVPVLKRTQIVVEHYNRLVCTASTGIYSVKPTYT